jgi:hypothetical protein
MVMISTTVGAWPGYEVSCVQSENEFTVPAPVSEVWKTLLDAERLRHACPGRLSTGWMAMRSPAGCGSRSVIMTAPVPQGTVPPTRAML